MRKQLFLVTTLLAVTAWVLPAQAANDEVRIKLDGDTNLLGADAKPFTLRPMIRTEQRFRTQGLVLLKFFVGLRADLTSWFRLQSYYAHKDKLLKQHQQLHLLTTDLIFHHGFGPVSLSDRNGNEWQSDPGFYRYRNQLEIDLDPGLGWVKPWIADEVRVDSDQARMNLNDSLVGFDLIPRKNTKVRLYYDVEMNRRSKDTWAVTHVYGAVLSVHL